MTTSPDDGAQEINRIRMNLRTRSQMHLEELIRSAAGYGFDCRDNGVTDREAVVIESVSGVHEPLMQFLDGILMAGSLIGDPRNIREADPFD